ncbi:hypothetical protein [Nitrosomonas sp.]|uniref:hypothetical protein n=1 Tax=Nitrosomonas sp. TaxID=42353 RepID=UPI003306237C
MHNFGAAMGADTGFGIDLLVGRASQPRDWHFIYGYAQMDTDAVLTATTIPILRPTTCNTHWQSTMFCARTLC